jgi:hypothetical protein
MTQQTAVEWMIKEIESLITIETFEKWKAIKEQAKAMDKQQKIDSFVEGVSVPYMEAIGNRRLWVSPQDPTIDAEQYYTETYGNP